jgi:hypothetical protein
MKLLPEGLIKFFIYVFITIVVTYMLQPLFRQFWYILLLFIYFRSKDESFWFAFFLVVSDGFMSFLGTYEAGLSLLPGLPAIDVSQVFILLTLIKASRNRSTLPVFYTGIMQLLLIYLIFLVIWGFMIGPPSQLNEVFRIFKLIIPLFLFYSVPRLIKSETDYKRFFSFLFPVVVMAFFTQIFNIIFGMSPAEYLGVTEIGRYSEDYSRGGEPLRVFYNTSITLISFFAALYFITRENKKADLIYLSVIVMLSFIIAFLSATRGWIIAFSITLLLYVLFVIKTDRRISLGILLIAGVLFLATVRIRAVREQIEGSWKRISTIEAAAGGDFTMRGTNIRTTVRSDRVLAKWKENPIFGWGFSDTYFSYGDGHVGNQSILLHSGIIGALLMFTFFARFNLRLLMAGTKKNNRYYNKSFLVFVIFFIGWFIIHSTSGQQFAFSGSPGATIPQSLFFSFGALSLADAGSNNPPE